MTAVRPPRLARWLASRLLPAEHRTSVLAELDEDFRRHAGRRGSLAASWRYWVEVVRVRPLAWRAHLADTHSTRVGMWFALGHDVKLGWRAIRRRTGVSAAVAATFALGVGATTAGFSVVDAVLLEGLPYPETDRLAVVWNRLESTGASRVAVSGPDLLDYRRGVAEFAGLAGIWTGPSTLTGPERTYRIVTAKVTENFFDVLGTRPLLGRTFRPGEGSSMDFTTVFDRDAERVPGAVVLTHGSWSRWFGADSSIVGQSIRLAGDPVTVLGVLPRAFEIRLPPESGVSPRPDLFEAFRSQDLATNPRGARWLTAVARLGPRTTVDQARVSLERVAADLRTNYREHAETGVYAAIAPLEREVSRSAAPTVLLLLAASGFVFLVACANVANLLLVRAIDRRTEMAVRSALGCSRPRLVRQVAVETGMLGVAGGAAGAAIAVVAVDALSALRPDSLAVVRDVGVDASVLGFAILITTVGALVTGLFPAVSASTAADRGFGRPTVTASRPTARLQGGLVVAEVAVSVVLLVAAAVLIQALGALGSIDPGFDPDGVASVEVALPEREYTDEASRLALYQLVAEAAWALPAVESAGGVDLVPLAPGAGERGPYWLEQDDREAASGRRAVYHGVLPGYFAAVGTGIRRGRAFEPRDMRADTPRVVIVDELFAAQHWPGADPIGRRFEIVQFDYGTGTFTREWTEIVGVAEPARYEHLAIPPAPTIYVPLSSYLWSSEVAVVVRTRGSVGEVAATLRARLAAIDADIAVSDPVLLTDLVAADTATLRFLIAVATALAALASVLAVVGLHSLVSYLVRTRAREIAVRMAFGATVPAVTRMVLRRGAMLGVSGVVIGVFGAVGVARVLASRMVSVNGVTPSTIVVTSTVLIAVALAATLLPARRAARIDPMVSLRDA